MIRETELIVHVRGEATFRGTNCPPCPPQKNPDTHIHVLTKLYEVVRPLSSVDIVTMLVAEVLVDIVEITERQLRRVGRLT